MSLNALGLPPTATAAEVKEIWRRKASDLHPDHGGDPAEFTKWRKIYEEALAEAEAPKPCDTCNGKKIVVIMNGWNSLSVVCSHCGGTGLKKMKGNDNE